MQNIPRVSQPMFLHLFKKGGGMDSKRCKPLAQFIAAVTNDPKALLLSEKSGLLPPSQVEAMVNRFLEGGTKWEVRDPGTYDYGYQVEVVETLIEYQGKETVVWEISASYLSRDGTRINTDIREWFDRDDLEGLLMGIECRVRIPRQMYTGLDSHGCNL